LKEFYNQLYTLLNDVFVQSTFETNIVPVVLQCFQLMLMDSGQLSLQRIAAYIKRLLTLSLHLPHNASLAIISVVHKLLLRYPKTQQLLDTECVGSGEYTPEVEDPENCNAFASTAWEFALLNKHVHPVVKSYSQLVCKMEKIEGNYTPLKLWEFYSPNTDDVDKGSIKGISYCNPPISNPKPHVLDKKLQKLKNKEKKK